MTTSRGVLAIGFFYLLISLTVVEVDGRSSSYDYGFNPECLPSPMKPQYGGGMVVNSELNDEGLRGWSSFGEGKLAKRVSKDGNKFIVVSGRNGSDDSLSQSFVLKKGSFYVISAWLQVSRGKSPITAAFRTRKGSVRQTGTVLARSGCWSMLKGGITAKASGVAQLYFQSDDASVDIWVDSVSVQPFTQEEWMSHRIQSIEKARRRKVRLQAVDPQGQPLASANITIQQLTNYFPIGSAINANILTNQAYQKWFASRFKVTVFENELKWYSTETSPGKEDYTVADSLMKFAQNLGVKVRGHNIFWDDPTYNPGWVKALSPSDLQAASDRRIQSVAGRYKGQLIHWDVVNENLHFNFFESKLGSKASTTFYQKAHQIDPTATPFLNEFNTLESKNDAKSSPAKYLEKISEITSGGYNGPLGIGLEGHFSTPDLAYIRSALDVLAAKKLVIWITELDVSAGPNQASYLNQIMRELLAYPAVRGIVLWTAWAPQGCYRMCLTDNNFKNLPTGDVVDKILAKWTNEGLSATTDANGYFEALLFHGDYEAKVNDPQRMSSFPPSGIKFRVTPATVPAEMLDLKLMSMA